MTVLVTGGAGYIGSHMTWYLTDSGEEVEVLDDLSTGFDWSIPGHVKLHVGNVGDPDVLDEIFQKGSISAVIHFAGSVVVPESVSDPLKYYTNNTKNSLELIKACVRHGVGKFVFSSTAAVYGEPATSPTSEDAPKLPLSPYGYSKLMTERMLIDASLAHDFSYTILRYFNVAGADPKLRTGQSSKAATHLIKVACETALGKRESVSIFGTDFETPDGTGIRDYIHVWDLVHAHYVALAAMNKENCNSIYNCGYGTGYSVREVLDSVKTVSGVDFPVLEADRRDGDGPRIVANSELIRRSLKWKPEHADLDEIVTHALSWEEKLGLRNRH